MEELYTTLREQLEAIRLTIANAKEAGTFDYPPVDIDRLDRVAKAFLIIHPAPVPVVEAPAEPPVESPEQPEAAED